MRLCGDATGNGECVRVPRSPCPLLSLIRPPSPFPHWRAAAAGPPAAPPPRFQGRRDAPPPPRCMTTPPTCSSSSSSGGSMKRGGSCRSGKDLCYEPASHPTHAPRRRRRPSCDSPSQTAGRRRHWCRPQRERRRPVAATGERGARGARLRGGAAAQAQVVAPLQRQRRAQTRGPPPQQQQPWASCGVRCRLQAAARRQVCRRGRSAAGMMLAAAAAAALETRRSAAALLTQKGPPCFAQGSPCCAPRHRHRHPRARLRRLLRRQKCRYPLSHPELRRAGSPAFARLHGTYGYAQWSGDDSKLRTKAKQPTTPPHRYAPGSSDSSLSERSCARVKRKTELGTRIVPGPQAIPHRGIIWVANEVGRAVCWGMTEKES